MDACVSLCFQYLVLSHFVGYITCAHEKRLVLDEEQDVFQLVKSLQAEFAAFKSEMSSLKPGSVYTRWGRTTCPGNGTEMIYHGHMAGSKYDNHGGGANSVCLASDPTWSKYVDGVNSGGAIFGTEIEMSDSNANVLFGKPISNEDVPCAVCRSRRPSTVMIPGRANCYPGWAKEYQGYLVASNPAWNNNADYVCLDSGLEFLPHGAASDDEHVINVVEVRCGHAGSLPCPPYVDGREVACVVCSK